MLFTINRIGRYKKGQVIILSVLYILLASGLGYRLVLYPTAQMIPFLALALAAIFIIWRPVFGTALYLIAYPMVPPSGSINMVKMAMLLLTVFLFAIWLWRKLRVRDYAWQRPEYKWMFLFFVYICFSPFLGPANGFTIMDWARDIAPLLNLLLIPMLTEQFNERKNHWLLYLLIIPISISLVRDMLNLMRRFVYFPFNPLNYFAYGLSTLHVSLLFCLGTVLFLYKAEGRYFYLSLALVSLINAVMTITRTVWLSVIFTVAQMVALYTKYRRLSILIMAGCILAVGLIYFSPQEYSVSLKTSEYKSSWWSTQKERIYGIKNRDIAVMNRNIEFHQAKQVFLSSPVVGRGFGYIYRFWRYHVSGLGGSGFWYSNYTHNDIINMLAKGGLFGFSLWAVMILAFVKKLLQKKRDAGSGLSAALATVGIIAIVNSIFVGLSTPVYQTREAMFFLCAVIAVSLSNIELKRQGGRDGSVYNNSKL